MFKKSMILAYLDILPDTFSFHTTSTLLFIFQGRSIKYVPIKTFPRRGSSTVSVYSGINSIRKIFILTMHLRPVRIASLLYPLGIILWAGFLAGFFIAEGTVFLWGACASILLTAVFFDINKFSRCDKNLIVEIL
jgi:hypothetical protein